ncbi:MAG: hypothetical protein ABFR50_00485 [Candidatus Fermentibacteria bacterium]
MNKGSALIVFLIFLFVSCSDPFGSGLSITVTHPPVGGAQADGSYIIKWTLSAPEYSDTGVLLFADTDLNPETGLIQISDSLSIQSSGYLWDCSLFPEDEYYIRAIVYEGNRHESDYSDGTIIVSHSKGIAKD